MTDRESSTRPALQPALRALANETRLTILEWLLDPTAHFPPQRDGDLVEDGVCLGFIAAKTGLSQPTVTEHMKTLTEAGLTRPKRIKNWVFHKAEREAIDAALTALERRLRRR